MENVKNFKGFINEELSPETYQRLSNVGRERGDPRGQRLMNTASELNKKNGITIQLHKKNGDSITAAIFDAVDLSDKGAIYLTFKDQHNAQFGLFMRYDNIYPFTLKINQYDYYLSRKDINQLSQYLIKKFPDIKELGITRNYPSL